MQLSDAVRHAEENERTIAGLYERTKDLAGAGRLPLPEVGRVAQEKLQAQDVLVQAQKQYKQARDEFKITVSLPTDVEFRLDATELEALEAAMGKPVDFSEAEGIETALAWRLDLANSADAVIDAERKVAVAANMLKADLNLFGVISPVSAGRGNVSLQKKWEDFFQLGGELNLPLDRLAERNVLRQTLISLGRSERQYELNVDTVKLEVRNAYRNLKEAAQRYCLQAEGVELARRRLETDSLLVQYGRAGSRQVLRAQKDLFDAENAASQTLVDYTIASLSFYRDTGVLTVRNDGMWNH
jgi:outer membrane protein TolC